MIKFVKNDFFIYCKEARIENQRSFYGSFCLGPFEAGQSITIANALRRTLLSELKGLAITSAEIEGAFHEYATLPGVRDSILDILLNLKDIVLKTINYGNKKKGTSYTATFKNEQIGYLKRRGPGIIRAADLKLPPGIQCVDPDQYIATLSEEGILNIKFTINEGKNYHIESSFLKQQSGLEAAKSKHSGVGVPERTYTLQKFRKTEGNAYAFSIIPPLLFKVGPQNNLLKEGKNQVRSALFSKTITNLFFYSRKSGIKRFWLKKIKTIQLQINKEKNIVNLKKINNIILKELGLLLKKKTLNLKNKIPYNEAIVTLATPLAIDAVFMPVNKVNYIIEINEQSVIAKDNLAPHSSATINNFNINLSKTHISANIKQIMSQKKNPSTTVKFQNFISSLNALKQGRHTKQLRYSLDAERLSEIPNNFLTTMQSIEASKARYSGFKNLNGLNLKQDLENKKTKPAIKTSQQGNKKVLLTDSLKNKKQILFFDKIFGKNTSKLKPISFYSIAIMRSIAIMQSITMNNVVANNKREGKLPKSFAFLSLHYASHNDVWPSQTLKNLIYLTSLNKKYTNNYFRTLFLTKNNFFAMEKKKGHIKPHQKTFFNSLKNFKKTQKLTWGSMLRAGPVSKYARILARSIRGPFATHPYFFVASFVQSKKKLKSLEADTWELIARSNYLFKNLKAVYNFNLTSIFSFAKIFYLLKKKQILQIEPKSLLKRNQKVFFKASFLRTFSINQTSCAKTKKTSLSSKSFLNNCLPGQESPLQKLATTTQLISYKRDKLGFRRVSNKNFFKPFSTTINFFKQLRAPYFLKQFKILTNQQSPKAIPNKLLWGRDLDKGPSASISSPEYFKLDAKRIINEADKSLKWQIIRNTLLSQHAIQCRLKQKHSPYKKRTRIMLGVPSIEAEASPRQWVRSNKIFLKKKKQNYFFEYLFLVKQFFSKTKNSFFSEFKNKLSLNTNLKKNKNNKISQISTAVLRNAGPQNFKKTTPFVEGLGTHNNLSSKGRGSQNSANNLLYAYPKGNISYKRGTLLSTYPHIKYPLSGIQKSLKNNIILEIWTNGSIHPRQALYDACKNLLSIFSKLEKARFTRSIFQSDKTYGKLALAAQLAKSNNWARTAYNVQEQESKSVMRVPLKASEAIKNNNKMGSLAFSLVHKFNLFSNNNNKLIEPYIDNLFTSYQLKNNSNITFYTIYSNIFRKQLGSKSFYKLRVLVLTTFLIKLNKHIKYSFKPEKQLELLSGARSKACFFSSLDSERQDVKKNLENSYPFSLFFSAKPKYVPLSTKYIKSNWGKSFKNLTFYLLYWKFKEYILSSNSRTLKKMKTPQNSKKNLLLKAVKRSLRFKKTKLSLCPIWSVIFNKSNQYFLSMPKNHQIAFLQNKIKKQFPATHISLAQEMQFINNKTSNEIKSSYKNGFYLVKLANSRINNNKFVESNGNLGKLKSEYARNALEDRYGASTTGIKKIEGSVAKEPLAENLKIKSSTLPIEDFSGRFPSSNLNEKQSLENFKKIDIFLKQKQINWNIKMSLADYNILKTKPELIDIGKLNISLRPYTCLKRANINTLADLLKKSKAELLSLKNFGKQSLKEVEENLLQLGLSIN